jgi:hypothetical protein
MGMAVGGVRLLLVWPWRARLSPVGHVSVGCGVGGSLGDRVGALGPGLVGVGASMSQSMYMLADDHPTQLIMMAAL